MKLTTRWEGTYSYDPIPELPSTFVDTAFVLNIRRGWFGKFSGEIRDSEPGIQEPASIKGWATLNRVRFTKTYPSFWISGEGGKLTRVPNLDPYVLHYDGRLDGDEGCQRIEGTWYIPPQHIQIGGQWFEMPQTTGTWIANSSAQNAK
ncbi:hypothetical protein [Roseiconus lacunae]|uniref:Uncharacterized protein n=1 Tax=Roseiconus lacunae TaxID=2605694 RepID=A0ABT7PSU3_9BACT|nr:hypothetical protein [Roseiconus lacunae]MDM4019574.1 hypothetical protein [Roseiconus lacunae]